jgi:hypothetical protein
MTQTTPQPKDKPHYRFYLEQIKEDYEQGNLTAKGALLMALRIMRRPGHQLRITNMDDFAKIIGCNARTCYSSINRLKEEKLIEWKDVAGIDIWIPVRKESAVAKRKIGIDQTISGTDQTINPTDQTISGTDQTINDTPLESLSEADSSDPPNSFSDNSSIFSQRERESAEDFEKLEQPSASLPEQNEPPTIPDNTGGDQSSAAPAAAPFDWKTYHWAGYEKAGDGGSDPKFWDWARDFVVGLAEKRANSDSPIGEIDAYTRKCIQTRAAAGYEKYLISIGVLAPPQAPPQAASQTESVRGRGIHWSESGSWENPPSDLSEEFALFKIHWSRLELGWKNPAFLEWIEKAQALQAFRWDNYSSLHTLPDWAVAKLAHDLSNTKFL